MDNYEINSNTLALIPINNKKTKVIEKERVIYLENNIMKIINNSCNFFGSSYKGRQEGTKKLIGISYKAPIIIEETKNIIYFPTTSPKLESCCWISLNNIKEYKKNDKKTLIIFENDIKIDIDISLGSFNNQYFHAIKLESILRKNIINL